MREHNPAARFIDDTVLAAKKVEMLDASNTAGGVAYVDSGTKIVLDPDIALSMADRDNALYVTGEAEDVLRLVGTWQRADESVTNDQGEVYHRYVAQSTSGQQVTLYVDCNIPTLM